MFMLMEKKKDKYSCSHTLIRNEKSGVKNKYIKIDKNQYRN